ncbi:hypothetical protein HJFPF1_10430 [Paramyrothecium foliicola]|nr:hypothetical protein HJFPF1_10430 [Paramyrothecium foliicola]
MPNPDQNSTSMMGRYLQEPGISKLSDALYRAVKLDKETLTLRNNLSRTPESDDDNSKSFITQPNIASQSGAIRDGLVDLVAKLKSNQRQYKHTSALEDILSRFRIWLGDTEMLHSEVQSESSPAILIQVFQHLDEFRDSLEQLTMTIREVDGDLRDEQAGDSDYDEEDFGLHIQDDNITVGHVEVLLKTMSRKPVAGTAKSTHLQRPMSASIVCWRCRRRRMKCLNHGGNGPCLTCISAGQDCQYAGGTPNFDTVLIFYQYVLGRYEKLSRTDDVMLALRLGWALARRCQSVRLPPEDGTLTSRITDLESDDSSDEADPVPDGLPNFEFTYALDLQELASLPRQGQSVECSFCLGPQNLHTERAWAKHVLRDLGAYVCTYPSIRCQEKIFETRDSWFEHELQHRSLSHCILCNTPDISSSHLESEHPFLSPEQRELVEDASVSVAIPTHLKASDCPFCEEWTDESRSKEGPDNGKSPVKNHFVPILNFKRHVARHQERLALSTLSLLQDQKARQNDVVAKIRPAAMTPADAAARVGEQVERDKLFQALTSILEANPEFAYGTALADMRTWLAIYALSTAAAQATPTFIHPGLLHTEKDFERVRSFLDNSAEPWMTGFAKLKARTNPSPTPRARVSICRGNNAGCTQNFPDIYRDAALAYANALYWKLTGDVAYAEASGKILDAWSNTLKEIIGSSDKFLASGLYGYQFANAAEILRSYAPWTGLSAHLNLLYTVFYPMNRRFLDEHNGNPHDHYWANWDLANLCTMHAIGVLADNATTVDEAVNYFKTGLGMGAIHNAIWHMHTEEDSGKPLGQNQEAGRDQGHALLDFALLGVLAQQSYNQGEDLFALESNRILAGSEYVFKYNVGHEVPFQTYTNIQGTSTVIGGNGRGSIRPIGELIYAHYNGVKGLNASWTQAYRDVVVAQGNGAEGGGGDYGTTSGGYDQLGFGTLMYRLEE